MALVANIHRDPKKGKAFKPSDFNPYGVKRASGVPLRAGNLGILRQVFVDRADQKNMPRPALGGQDVVGASRAGETDGGDRPQTGRAALERRATLAAASGGVARGRRRI